jgi:hypothetical protein
MRWFVLLFLVAPLHAQIIEVNGGTSTLYEASGAAVTVHLPQSTAYLSAGISGGHFGVGFAESRQYHGWDTTLGDKTFSGSAGGAGVGIVVRGVSMSRHGLTLFAGGTGPSYSAPYYSAASTQHIGAGLFYEHKFRGLEFSSLSATVGSQRTSVESLGYHWRVLRLSGAGGVLQNSRYLNASLDFQPWRWTGMSAARTTYSFATVNSVGGSARIGPVTLHGSAFNSRHTTGEAFGASARLYFLEIRADRFVSPVATSTTFMVGERLGRHFSIDQFISESRGHYSVNFGGTYTSNRFAVSVGYQTFFMPLFVGRSPFQRALAVTLSFRLPHDTAVTLQTNVDPTGKLRYGAYGSTFEYASLLQNASQPQHKVIKGGFVIRGIVSDPEGLPVVGAAVMIGGQIAYSGATGAFLVRVKRDSPVPVTVALDQFAAPGEWEIVQSGTSATPGTDVKIIVSRRPH